MNRFKDRTIVPEIGSWCKPQPTDQPGTAAGQNIPIQIGPYQTVELSRISNQWHAAIIDNDIACFDVRVFLGRLFESIHEEAIGHCTAISRAGMAAKNASSARE